MILRALLLTLIAGAAWAVEPDEMLDDPARESRARDISKGLRCLICRNESIDESDADLARDLRLLVRERIVEGDSDKEVVAFVVERYGEYVLLNPQRKGINLVLWAAAPVLLLTGLAAARIFLVRRRRSASPDALTAAERARLAELMDE
ncbi:MAG: cytochrome c-type biogenesis protein CcmH [Boseongicola sp. SB0677_bin_26]|nr:cytochrome c-type biogenesis protein CcmH [Boseongicola sp. SB0665_bin_10]MYG26646.1 cytochrome c-type biogenesis protein CcmH [Boseongicola sp. SB0677_bin_26]